MLSDPIADLLTRLRNAYLAHKKQVVVPHSRLKESMLKLMLKHEFVADFKVAGKKPKLSLEVNLKYDHKRPALTTIKRISRPGARIYASVDKLPRLRRGLGITILSSSKGLLTLPQALKQNLGGELICRLI